MQPSWIYDERRALPLVEHTLLWSMRAWVVGLHGDPVLVNERIAAAFADLGSPACAAFLDGFMWVLRHGAKRTIGVDCPCHAELDGDERVLLRVFGLAQHNDRATAIALMQDMVSSGAARACLDSAERLGAELAQAKRWIKLQLPRPTGRGVRPV